MGSYRLSTRGKRINGSPQAYCRVENSVMPMQQQTSSFTGVVVVLSGVLIVLTGMNLAAPILNPILFALVLALILPGLQLVAAAWYSELADACYQAGRVGCSVASPIPTEEVSAADTGGSTA